MMIEKVAILVNPTVKISPEMVLLDMLNHVDEYRTMFVVGIKKNGDANTCWSHTEGPGDKCVAAIAMQSVALEQVSQED